MSGNLAKIERLTSQLKNIRGKATKVARIGTNSALAGGGGLAAGAIDAKLPKLPNTNIDTAGAVGGLGVLAAMSGVFDEHSDSAGSFFGGMVAYVLGREARQYFS